MSNNQTTNQRPTPEIGDADTGFWSIRGLALHLGVSTSHLYNLKNAGKLTTLPFGGTFAVRAADAWELERRRAARRKTREETHREEKTP